jgi:hypothetical protein
MMFSCGRAFGGNSKHCTDKKLVQVNIQLGNCSALYNDTPHCCGDIQITTLPLVLKVRSSEGTHYVFDTDHA